MEAASNAGLEIAKERKADLIIIHDDDDSWSPEFLSIMVQELQMYENLVPSVKGIICRTNLVYERIEGNVIIIDHLESSPHKPPFPEVGILRFSELLDSYHNFSPIQFLYRAEVLDVVGMYDPLFKVLGDWEFNLRFLQHFDIALIPNHLAFYHQRVSAIGADLNSLHEVERKVQWESYRQCIHNKYLREGSAMGLLMNFPIDRILTQLSSLQARVAELEGNTKKGKKHAK
jgi:glycosyltransferase involved in cell wall biosynthesis